jgi:hypothetical protein
MNWIRVRAALIRGFWAIVMPLIGSLVVYLLEPGVLEEVGVTNAGLALVIGGLLYGLKKLAFPDTVL